MWQNKQECDLFNADHRSSRHVNARTHQGKNETKIHKQSELNQIK